MSNDLPLKEAILVTYTFIVGAFLLRKITLAKIPAMLYTIYAVLCGELAVPCNLQSATAEQTASRGLAYGGSDSNKGCR